MAKVAVFGATGRLGTLVIKQLSEAGFDVTAVVRNATRARTLEQFSQVPFEVLSFSDSVSKIALLLKNFDALVFAAGASNLTDHAAIVEVELDGALKVIEAAEQAGLKRVVFVSSIGASDRDFWFDNEEVRTYYIAKRTLDKFLERSVLDYTIIEPGPLVDEEGTGKIRIPKEAYQACYEEFDFKDNYYAIKVPREDVAKAIVLSLENQKAIRKTIPLTQGDTAIEDVIENYL